MKRFVVGLIILGMLSSLFVDFNSISFAQRKYKEAPMLAELVKAGKLPPVEQRLPEEPMVVDPIEEIGNYGGTLRVAMVSPATWAEAGQLTMEFFIERDPRDYNKFIPGLAKSWKLTNQGKTFTLTLRKGLKWSDGVPFTADDIIFWWEDVILNDDLTPVKPRQWIVDGKLMKVEKVDQYTVRFHFAAPYYAAPYLFSQVAGYGCQGQGFLPKHALMKYHIKYNPEAGKLAKEAKYDYWWQLFQYKAKPSNRDDQQHPDIPTMGPWIVKEILPDGVIWERNPYYWKVDTAGNQLPYIDKLRGVFFREAPNLIMLITTGQIDLSNGWGTGIQDYPTIVKNASQAGYRYWLAKDIWPSAGTFHFNQNYKGDEELAKLLRNKKFRQALSLAIDRKDIIKTVGLGNGVAYQATCNPECSFYEESWSKAYTEYDPQKANRLLDQLGLTKRDSEGYRLMPNGKPLTLVVELTSDMAYWVPICELVKQHWAKVGIRMQPKVQERSLYWQRLGAGEMQINLWVLDGFTEPCLVAGRANFLRAWWWAPQWYSWWNTGGKSGEEPPADIKKLFDLCNKIPHLPPAQMRNTMKQILRKQAEELWMIGTVGFIGKPAIAKVNLGNINTKAPGDAHDVGGSRMIWAEQIFWKK